jgi:tripartite ATP-independent transporter DctM subunit
MRQQAARLAIADPAVAAPVVAVPVVEHGLLCRLADRTGETVILAALLGEVGVIFLNVLSRSLFDVSILWTQELARIALAVLAFVGGVMAYRRGQHTILRVVLNRLAPAPRQACMAMAEFLVLGLAVLVFALALAAARAAWTEETPIMELPGGVFVLPLIFSMPLLAFYAVDNLRRAERGAVGIAATLFLLLLAVGIATHPLWIGWFGSDGAVTAALALLVASSVIGLPIGFALLLATACYFWLIGTVPMFALAQKMVDGTSNFVLLALPFFIFAGLIMERGGISLRLVRFVHALVGHLRGGLLQVVVVSMYLVSGLSGSKTADVAAVGSVMRQMLARHGYDAGEATAVIASAAVMGDTVPPSIGILVLGSITQLSIAALFIGGVIPAAVIGLCLMLLINLRARRANLPRVPRARVTTMLRAGAGAILPLSMPALLFGGILGGVATPTEVSSFAVLYGLLLGTLVYRAMDARGLLRAAIDSATLAGMILFILAAAASFSWALTIAYVPQRLVMLLHGLHGSQAIFLVGSIALLIVTGMLLEGLPALNILAPMLVPMAGQFGLSGLHYGIVLLIAMGLGAFLPPVGVGFFVCCAIMGTSLEQASRAMMPYLAVLLIGLLIVAFVPWFTLVLPDALGFGD